MGLFNLFGGGRDAAMAEATRDAGEDRWFEGGGARSEIDVAVSIERARKVPVIRDCLHTLSENVAGLQFGCFQRLDERRRRRLDQHPAMRLLSNPNRRQTSYEFLACMVDDLASHGDFMARMIFDAAGNVVELRRINPDPAVTHVDEVEGVKRFTTRDARGQDHRYLEEEVWHIPLPPLKDGLRGTSPILDDGREAVAVAIALQRYANILFKNDGTPPYAITMDGNFKGADDKKNFLKAWRRWTSGKNRHTPAVLEYGMKPTRMGLTAEEAQFLETRKELWLDLTRLWRVPPHKVGIMDKATFSNIEHQALEFVTDTLRPVLELIERSVAKFLIEEDDVFFEFNVESLLRGDIKTRFEAYALGRQWGWLSVNDVLRMENLNGIGAAGDRYVEPLNMVPVGTGPGGRERDERAAIDRSIAFLRETTARNGGRPRLELVKHAA
ncbi:phage portal protein [Arenibacterium halophilum]|uniref:Phage portal protein n=1 Tax=Arenibacterium halophilum TaxID=2583821 RepID=A0ABY2WXU4_9RHOB|nr:phage portal protein [Arenibacterium halophilum]TMV07309.1 phage portal protein [Arenibacterium halophilum]